jgi:hypothetical protein
MSEAAALTASLADVRARAGELLPLAKGAAGLSDSELLAVQRGMADLRRTLDAVSATFAGEIAERSRKELGHAGLAQRSGYRNAQALVQEVSRSTGRDAVDLVTVGLMISDSSERPWLKPVAEAVGAGRIDVAAARAIERGLGERSDHIADEAFLSAADQLTAEATVHDADRVLKRARELRDDLDAAGIADRERAAYEARSLIRRRMPSGLNQYVITPDIESAALWDDLYDAMTAPRRGGPRFVDETEANRAAEIASDSRTLEQFAFDGFTGLLRIAAQANTTDARTIIGARQPAVRVLVAASTLERGEGGSYVEGQSQTSSVKTAERLACANGVVPIVVDSRGQVLHLGREQRLFTAAQRLALAARDGGCVVDGCDTPPGWTEAHHWQHFKRDNGKTDIENGVLLCRFHHLNLHNNGWEIVRDSSGQFWLEPPPGLGAGERRRLLASKSRALRDELKATAE